MVALGQVYARYNGTNVVIGMVRVHISLYAHVHVWYVIAAGVHIKCSVRVWDRVYVTDVGQTRTCMHT